MAKEHNYLFVSDRGDLRPTWREAFPRAVAARPGQATGLKQQPALVWLLLDARSPAAAMAEVRSSCGNDVPCVVLSDMPDDDEAIACFTAAARGYCNGNAVPLVLKRVAEVVTQGGLWIGETLMARLLRGTAAFPPAGPAGERGRWSDRLTARESEVAKVVAEGSSNKEIARRLNITERTVKAHVGAIFEKLSVRDRLQLALAVNGQRGSWQG